MQNGFKIELMIKNMFRLKKYGELLDYQKDIIKIMFGEITDDQLIYSDYCTGYYKPDIYIRINDEIRYISIKSGKSNSIHFEKIESLIKYLRRFNISEYSQKVLLLYHYGDGTLNGTGKNRLNYDEIKKVLESNLQKLNRELNKPDLILQSLERFVYTGLDNKQDRVDYILFVDSDNIENMILTSRTNLTRFVLSKNYDHLIKPHIGPMTIQPYLRDVNRVSKKSYKRNYIQIKWNGLKKDMKKSNSLLKK